MIRVLRWTSVVTTSNLCKNRILICRKVNPLKYNVTSIVRFSSQVRKVSNRLLNKLRDRDRIPNDYSLIYNVPYSAQLVCYHFGLAFITPIVLVYFVGTLYQLKYVQFPLQVQGSLYFDNVYEFMILSCVVVWYCYGLYSLCTKLPLRIYYNENTKSYKAVLLGIIPLRPVTVEFPEKSAVKARQLSRCILPMITCRYNVNGHIMYLFETCFRTTSDFFRILKCDPTPY